MKENKYFIAIFILIIIPFIGFSQTEKYIQKADSLHKTYNFQAAKLNYSRVIKSISDTLIINDLKKRIISCDNGINLLKFCSENTIRANQRFNINDFFLKISGLKDSAWIDIPNHIVKTGEHNLYKAIFFDYNQDKFIFSKKDETGSWNLYQTTKLNNNLWSTPELLNDNIKSNGDEIYPLLSSNGKELYFSSNGHYGMGGFDLYLSKWDEKINDWGIPENLGFPYSSTADDILFYNTPDGKYSIVASTRDCPKDSVAVIVSDYININIKKEFKDIENIQNLARQEVANKNELIIDGIEEEIVNQKMDTYSQLVLNMRKLQKKYDILNNEVNENRGVYESTTNEDDKNFLAKIIQENESKANLIKVKLDSSKIKVQNAELKFLSQGIIPNYNENLLDLGESQNQPEYKFANNHKNKSRPINFEKPKETFDYSFKILDKARFAPDNSLPNTLVYQIQILVTTKKVGIKSLKGLSPVYEHKLKSNKYLYTVGLFKTFKEANSKLNLVKRKGFKSAFIIAYNEGKSLNVKKARLLENKTIKTYQIVLSGYEDQLPKSVITSINASCKKDIVKAFSDNGIIYIVGPFDSKSQAEEIANTLINLGIKGISVKFY